MTTAISTAITAVLAALNTPTAVCPDIARVRLRAVSADAPLAVSVQPVSMDVLQTNLPGMPVVWNTTIAVQCYSRSGVSTAPDLAIDALVELVYARLMADATLGGAVVALKPKGITYDFDADGNETTCTTLVFEAMQRTQGNTLA